MSFKNTTAIILAAGKGTRIKAKDVNKVMFELGNKPMISYAVDRLKQLKIGRIVLVIGFAKDSVVNYFKKTVDYAVQEKRLGTGHAVKTGLKKIKKNINYILVFYGDDSAFYPKRLFERVINACQKENIVLSFLTLEKQKPFGLGRIIRNKRGNVIKIIEEKNATPSQRKTKEANLGCYCFKRGFLENFIGKIKKNKLKGEYYLTDIVEMAIKADLPIKAIKIKNENFWHGVNTQQEFLEAQEKIEKLNHSTHE